MSCSINEARDEMFSIFKGVWDPLLYPAIYSDTTESQGDKGSAPDSTIWSRVSIRHAEGYQSSLTGPYEGIKRFTNTGLLIIQIFSKVGQGTTLAYDISQIVLTAYRSTRNSKVWFKSHKIKEIGTKGAYSQVNVQIEFSYDTIVNLPVTLPGYPEAPVIDFQYNFLSPSLQWTINHNLGRRVSADAYTLGGIQIWAEVIQVNINQTIILFDSPQTGYAIVDY